MNFERTKEFYSSYSLKNTCQCAYCQNYIKEIRSAYPLVAEYLEKLGINIERPFETLPLEPDEYGNIEYLCGQYIVLGNKNGFIEKNIDGVNIEISKCHPSTNIKESHFVIEIYPIHLKWTIES